MEGEGEERRRKVISVEMEEGEEGRGEKGVRQDWKGRGKMIERKGNGRRRCGKEWKGGMAKKNGREGERKGRGGERNAKWGEVEGGWR